MVATDGCPLYGSVIFTSTSAGTGQFYEPSHGEDIQQSHALQHIFAGVGHGHIEPDDLSLFLSGYLAGAHFGSYQEILDQ